MFGWNETTWFSILTGAAVKSVAVLDVAWIVAFALRKQSAALRHVVWTAAFAAILALPFLSAALPALRVPLAGALLTPVDLILHATATASSDAGGTRAAAPSRHTAAFLPAGARPDWRMWLMLLWATGATLALTRTLVAYTAAWRVRRSAGPFPDCALCGALARPLGLRHPVDVLELEPGAMPMTFGLWRSVILMPADAAAWNEEKRRVVLLHELAHVRRGDAATHLLARTAMALHWWNPLAWTAWREFLKERERAADDLVLNAGARASEYAGHLLEVARTMQGPPMMAWAAAAIARRSQLEGRLLAILDSGVNRSAPSRASVLAAVLVAAAMIAPLAAVRAQDADTQAVPADVDVTIRAAQSQKNFKALDAAAKAATRLGQYDTAQRLLESALAIRGEVSGQQSVDYGVGLIKLADVKQKRDPKSEAGLYGQAAQILGDRPEAARALTHLGLAALAKHDNAQAFEFFQHLQQAAPAQAGNALMWMAVVRQQEKSADEADRLYQSAIAAQEPESAAAAVTMETYAQFLKEQGREGDADELRSRAAAIRKANAKPAPALPADVYRVGKGVSAPVSLHRREPEYDDEARVARLQGTVVVLVVIGTDGLAHDAHILRGLGLGLDENAVEAISRWQFKPGEKDGQPVKVAATIEVNFRLY
jgi:TonB family protein